MDEIKLSEFCDNNEKNWDAIEKSNVDGFIGYLNNELGVNLYEAAKTNDSLEVYKKLHIWLLQYKQSLIKALLSINVSYESFQKTIIYSLILSITRKSPNVDFLIQVFKSNNIIVDLEEYETNKYRLVTQNFGEIYFETAKNFFQNDIETLNYIDKLGNELVNGCHEVSFYLIKKYSDLRAVTSICNKGLNKKYYHSFVLNGDMVIDFTSNLVMPKDSYYLLSDVEELNNISYLEYSNEKDDSIEFDESKTLFPLLRVALYKQYMNIKEELK